MNITAMVVQQLGTSYNRLKRCLGGLRDDEARRLLAGQLTPITWQFGHLAFIDAAFVKRGGGTYALPPRYADLFNIGTGGEADYPPLDAVWSAFDGAHRALLQVAAEADYSTPLDRPSYTNVGEMLIFACHHRGYHLGKINTLRALLGKPRLFG